MKFRLKSDKCIDYLIMFPSLGVVCGPSVITIPNPTATTSSSNWGNQSGNANNATTKSGGVGLSTKWMVFRANIQLIVKFFQKLQKNY
jgi:hypothetical protein